jgi:hypothetical protein
MRAIPISPEGCWVIFAGFSRYARVNKMVEIAKNGLKLLTRAI